MSKIYSQNSRIMRKISVEYMWHDTRAPETVAISSTLDSGACFSC